MENRFKYANIRTLIDVFMGDFDLMMYDSVKNDPNKISDYRDGEITITSEIY